MKNCLPSNAFPINYDSALATRTALKCSCPGSVSFSDDTVAQTSLTVTSLNINVSNFEHPCIQLSFAANISTEAITGINFQILKQCHCQQTALPVSASYAYVHEGETAAQSPIYFTVCDCDLCFDPCCTYTVIVTVALDTINPTTISNAVLSAVITEKKGC